MGAERTIVLSDRMSAVAAFVTAGNRVCDVGCDHAWIPLYLVQQGISPGALAMDVREGPLKQAQEHIAEYITVQDKIKTRLSDGLSAYHAGEADCLICAGMGGRLMMRILDEDREKTATFREFVFAPQSEIQQFRAYLRERGYLIADENMIEEDGKFYPVMRAVTEKVQEGQEIREKEKKSPEYGDFDKSVTLWESMDAAWHIKMEDRYGPILLRKKHPVLYRYLERERRICKEVLAQIDAQGSTDGRRSARYQEIETQMQDCERIMEGMRYGNDQD